MGSSPRSNRPARLEYLVFDASDEDGGACSFDALASVMPQRLAALAGEIDAVLGWAAAAFGPPGEEGEWDFDLQATGESDEALEIGYDGKVSMPRKLDGRVTVALTVGGSAAFGTAFRERFPDAD